MDEATLKKYQQTAASTPTTATYIDADGNKQTGNIVNTYQALAADTANGGTGITLTGAELPNTYSNTVMPTTSAEKTVNQDITTSGTEKTVQGTTVTDATDAGTEEGNQTIAGIYQQIYEDNKAANEAARVAANEEATRLAEEQKAAAAQEYADTNKTLYSDYMHSVKNLPEQLAAYGINGGLAESSRVKLESNYGSNLGANERARLAGEREIDSELASQIYQNQATADAANQSALSAYQQQQAELAQTNAETLASIGDYSGYVELGILTEEEAAQMQKAWIAKNKALAKKLGYIKSSSYTGTGGGGNTITVTQYQDILAQAYEYGGTEGRSEKLAEMNADLKSGDLKIVKG